MDWLSKPLQYILVDGKPVAERDLLKWAAWYQNEARIIRQNHFVYRQEKQELVTISEEDYVATLGPRTLIDEKLNAEQELRQRAAEEKKRELGGIPIKLSTIFLGIDHSYTREGPPILWETMLFSLDHHDHGQWRYSSLEAAITGHEMILRTLHYNPKMMLKIETAEDVVKDKVDDPR